MSQRRLPYVDNLLLFFKDDADIQWKFSRTRMWMPYLDEGNVLPPPFNLIPHPYLVIRLCRRFCADPSSFMVGGEA